MTKVDPANVSADRFLSSVDRSLERLSTDRVDLLLLHWPPSAEPLKAVLDRLEEARDSGRARAVGVSNFTPAQMRLAAGRLHIGTNQVEFHPFLDQSALLREARRLGVRLAAYCPLARGAVIGHPVVADVARRHGRTDAQIVLRWIVQQGVAAVAMSTKPANAASNLDIFGFELSDRDMERIGALGAERPAAGRAGRAGAGPARARASDAQFPSRRTAMRIAHERAVIAPEAALHVVRAAVAHAEGKGWEVCAAVCDPAGHLVALLRTADVVVPAIDYAIDKAYTAACLRTSTQAFFERRRAAPRSAWGWRTGRGSSSFRAGCRSGGTAASSAASACRAPRTWRTSNAPRPPCGRS